MLNKQQIKGTLHQDAQGKIADEVADKVAKDTVQAFGDDIYLKLSEESGATLKLKCGPCDFESFSEEGLRQHIRRKHQISQMDETVEVDPNAENILKKIVQIILSKNKKQVLKIFMN